MERRKKNNLEFCPNRHIKGEKNSDIRKLKEGVSEKQLLKGATYQSWNL